MGAASDGTATALGLLLLLGGLRQVRAGAAAELAARRDGGPDPGVGADPRGDDGDGRRLPGRPVELRLRAEPRPRRRRSSSSAWSRCSGARSSGAPRTTSRRRLAGSTMSQIGYMMLAAGIGPAGYAFAIFHLLTHGFFKANMFLGAGSVMHAMNDEVDMRRYGALRKRHADHVRDVRLRLPGDHRLPAASPASGRRTRSSRRRSARTSSSALGALLGAGITGVLHDPGDADDVHRREALGQGRAPARVAAGDDRAADGARRAVRRSAACCCSTTGSSTGSSRSSGPRSTTTCRCRRSAITLLVLAVVAVGVAVAWMTYGQREVPGRRAAAGLAVHQGGARRPLRRRAQRGGVHAARPVPHPVAGLRRQPRRRRRRQRPRRAGRRHVRPDPALADRLRPLLRAVDARRLGARSCSRCWR